MVLAETVQSVWCLQALWRDRQTDGQTPAPYHNNTSRQVGRIKNDRYYRVLQLHVRLEPGTFAMPSESHTTRPQAEQSC